MGRLHMGYVEGDVIQIGENIWLRIDREPKKNRRRLTFLAPKSVVINRLGNHQEFQFLGDQ